jgi:hypothetical protein
MQGSKLRPLPHCAAVIGNVEFMLWVLKLGRSRRQRDGPSLLVSEKSDVEARLNASVLTARCGGFGAASDD